VQPFEVGKNLPMGPDGKANALWSPYTRSSTEPPPRGVGAVWLSREGLPIGLQIAAGHYKDALVLRAAARYAEANPLKFPVCRRPSDDRRSCDDAAYQLVNSQGPQASPSRPCGQHSPASRRSIPSSCFQHLDPDAGAARRARLGESAEEGGKRSATSDGVAPHIKDMVLDQGMPTRMGSLATDADGPWTVDAPVASACAKLATVLSGQDDLAGIGWKGRDRFGPVRATTIRGRSAARRAASSGGGVAAEAVGMGNLAVGTDGAGSVRIPCAFHRPVWPETHPGPRAALSAVGPGTLSHIGPMTRTVRDAAMMMNVMARPIRATSTAGRRRRGLPQGFRQGREGPAHRLFAHPGLRRARQDRPRRGGRRRETP